MPRGRRSEAALNARATASRSGSHDGLNYNAGMARYTLVYGVRLIPEGSLKGLEEARIALADGTTAGLTLHTFDGTIPQLRRSLDRSLDAFFDLLPGAEDEDLEKFAD